MLTNLLDNNVMGQVLSGILGAVIASIASFLLLRFNYKDLFAKTISQDRIVWLKQMREYAENLFHYIRNNNSKGQRDYNGKTYYDYAEPILLRLNLNVDEYSDEGKIIALIKGDFETLKNNLNSDNENDLLCLFRSMLKNEWDKVKCEAKGYEEISLKNRFGKINFSHWIIKSILFVGLYILIGLIIGFYLFPKIEDKLALIVVGWIIYGLIALSILFLTLAPAIFKNIKTKEKGVEKIRMKKPFYKCWWFWLITVIAFLLCVGNILLAHLKTSGSNIFTAVSGWVSGIATAILGVIAVVQNRNYKKENDRILNEQQKINSQLMQEQNDSYWQKIQYDMYDIYRREISDFEKEFLKFSTTEFMATVLCDGKKMNAISKMMIFDKQLRNNATRALAFLRDCPFYCEDKRKLFDLFLNYLDEFKKLYDIIYNVVLKENCLNDLVNNLAHKNIEIEGKILMCYLGVKTEIQIFIQNIFDKPIASAKEMIQSNSDQNKNWRNKLNEKATGQSNG